MTELVEKIFNHAAERRFHPYLDIREYNHYICMEEQAEASIRNLLPQDQAKLLEKLRDARNYSFSIGQEAAFQAGLAIGLELSRL